MEQDCKPIPQFDGYYKEYRIPDQGVYNYVKNSINKTFTLNNNVVYQNIKDLTYENANDSQKKKLDCLFIKNGLAINPKRKRMANQTVDVEYITKDYIRSKSNQKKK